MKLVEQNALMGTVTYNIGDGRYVRFGYREVQEYGIELLAKAHGIDLPDERVPVFQRGREIGSVPATFDGFTVRSRTFLYDPRPGDFVFDRDHWEAASMLGPGDLDAVIGFERKPA